MVKKPRNASEFAEACQQFDSRENLLWHEHAVIAKAMARYFKKGVESGEIPECGPNEFIHHIALYLDDMWELFRTSGDIEACDFRRLYQKEFQTDQFPSLTEINGHLNGGILNRTNAILTLSFLVNKIVDEDDRRIQNNIQCYFYAQDTALKQQFQSFIRLVYKQGLADLNNVCGATSMSGVFGNVELRTFYSGGRVEMTFVKVDDVDQHFTFVGAEKEVQGKRFGIQSVYVDLGTAIDMIREVVKNWPPSDQSNHGEKRKKLFKINPYIW